MRPPANPHEIDPTLHLRRMLEYEVTHEPGFAAVDDRCEQRITVELYQLESGWTVFARYSGTEREEKIDHAELDEFAELAQRIAFALLRNQLDHPHHHPRERAARRQRDKTCARSTAPATSLFGMGTAMRVAEPADRTGRSATRSQSEWRFLTPVSIQIGYRRKLRAWGLDAFGRLNLGTENTGVHNNDLGGHVDYSKSGLARPALPALHRRARHQLVLLRRRRGVRDRPVRGDPARRDAHRQTTRDTPDRRRPEHRPARRLRVPARQLGPLLRPARARTRPRTSSRPRTTPGAIDT